MAFFLVHARLAHGLIQTEHDDFAHSIGRGEHEQSERDEVVACGRGRVPVLDQRANERNENDKPRREHVEQVALPQEVLHHKVDAHDDEYDDESGRGRHGHVDAEATVGKERGHVESGRDRGPREEERQSVEDQDSIEPYVQFSFGISTIYINLYQF